MLCKLTEPYFLALQLLSKTLGRGWWDKYQYCQSRSTRRLWKWKKENIKQRRSEEERGPRLVTNLVLVIFKSQSPRIKPENDFLLTNFVCLSSFIKSNPTGDLLIRQNPGFQLSLYKFIGWAFLGLSPYLYKW